MCILIYCPSNRTPSREALENSAANNPDGFGWAIITDNGVDGPERFGILTDKGMDSSKIIDGFLTARAAHPSMPALFHARITTHGKTGVDNCHPFLVENGTVLAHNGMLPIPERDGKSDTHQFATEWLPHLGVSNTLDDPDNFTDLMRFASGSKLVVLSVDPTLRYWSYIVNEHLGDWDDGIWYSNSSYLWARKTTSNYCYAGMAWGGHYNDRREWKPAAKTPREWLWTTCDMCRDEWLMKCDDTPECPTCGWCNECGSSRCVCDYEFIEDDLVNPNELAKDFYDPYNILLFGSWYLEDDGFMWVYDEDRDIWREARMAEYEAYEDLHCPIDDLVANPDNFITGTKYPVDQFNSEAAMSSFDSNKTA